MPHQPIKEGPTRHMNQSRAGLVRYITSHSLSASSTIAKARLQPTPSAQWACLPHSSSAQVRAPFTSPTYGPGKQLFSNRRRASCAMGPGVLLTSPTSANSCNPHSINFATSLANFQIVNQSSPRGNSEPCLLQCGIFQAKLRTINLNTKNIS